jgi:hypothetical protein
MPQLDGAPLAVGSAAIPLADDGTTHHVRVVLSETAEAVQQNAQRASGP